MGDTMQVDVEYTYLFFKEALGCVKFREDFTDAHELLVRIPNSSRTNTLATLC